jgi:hypothetical protein
MANLNLDEVSASFLFTVDDENCANSMSVDEEALQFEIANILALLEPSRIEIVNSVCNNDGSAGATITIGPSPATGGVRRMLSKRDQHAVALVYSLVETTSSLEDGTQRRRLSNGQEFHVGPMKIIPGPADAKLLESDPDMKLEEERIRAGKCDEKEELQDKRMLRMQEKIAGSFDSVLEELRLERQEVRVLELALGVVVVVGLLLFVVGALVLFAVIARNKV